MYLIDTNIISESRKGAKANAGVRGYFEQIHSEQARVFISAITVGELQRGVQLIRHRGDKPQAEHLAQWLATVLKDYHDNILEFGHSEALIWAHLRVPNPHNSLDKQIAATALSYNLKLVTRNSKDFEGTGVELLNPFD